MKAMQSVADILAMGIPELVSVDIIISEVLKTQSSLTDEVLTYLACSGGKRLRSTLVITVAKIGDGPVNRAIQAAVAAELIHLASLVHDDIIDGALLRRGRDTVSAKWGHKTAVLAGDYLFATAFGMLSETGLFHELTSMTRAIKSMCEGEIDEERYLFNPEMTDSDYMDYIYKKTASLIEACCMSGATIADMQPSHVNACREYGRKIGCAYQMVDDILDYTSKPDEVGKPVGTDLSQGILSLPVILALHSPRHGERVRALLSTKRLTEAQISEMIDIIADCDGIDYTYTKALRLVEEAKACLELLPQTESSRLLWHLADFVVHREF